MLCIARCANTATANHMWLWCQSRSASNASRYSYYKIYYYLCTIHAICINEYNIRSLKSDVWHAFSWPSHARYDVHLCVVWPSYSASCVISAFNRNSKTLTKAYSHITPPMDSIVCLTPNHIARARLRSRCICACMLFAVANAFNQFIYIFIAMRHTLFTKTLLYCNIHIRIYDWS